MSKFKPGLRVVVIDADTSELRKGVINASYEEVEIAIVKFDDGNVEKVSFDCLGIEPVSKPTEKEEEPTEANEPSYLSEITITPEEFKNKAVDLITDLVFNGEIPGVVATLFTKFSVDLSKRLFSETKEND